MDALSEVLRVCRLRGAVVLRAELSSPWALSVAPSAALGRSLLPEAQTVVLVHVVLSGRCEVRAGLEEALRLKPGEAAVVHGTPHRIASDEGAAEVPFASLIRAPIAGELVPVVHGRGGERAGLVSCVVGLDRPLCDPLLGALPALLRADLRGSPALASLEEALGFSLSGSDAPRAGGTATLGRLAELLFIEIVRNHSQAASASATGWLAGLNDRYVGRALALMHGRPGENWTVEKLARDIGLSRSALAERFTHLVGEPPITYLSGWRLCLGAQNLAGTHRSVESIAREAGYESAGAFSHAFKRAFGKPPSIWRKKSRKRAK
jgi:AraC-like DNA-binding protein